MIVKILGILDILTAILFWLFSFFHIIPSSIILLAAFYLLVKGLIFALALDAISIIDIIISILIFISLNFSLPLVIIFLIVLFLLQKGIISLL